MKFKIPKIPKLQGGGFATFTPILDSGPTFQQPTSGSSSNKESILDDDIYKELIKEGALVNDLNLFVSQIQDLESNPFAYNSESGRARGIQLIGMVNELKRNKERYTNAMATAKESGGLNEVAITSDNMLYVRGADGVQKVTTSEYSKNKEDYTPLTVAQVLNEREYNPNMAFDESVFEVAQNSIGMNSIVDRISKMSGFLSEATQISENTYSKTQVRDYIRSMGATPPTEGELNALKDLFETVESSPSEYTKIKTESRSKRQNINTALDYIWGTLDPSWQKKLNAVGAVNGRDGKQMVLQMLYTQTEPYHSEIVTPSKAPDGSSDATKGKGTVSWEELFYGAKTNIGERFAINTSTSPNYVLNVPITGQASVIRNSNGDAYTHASLADLKASDTLGVYGDFSKATFGNKKVRLGEDSQIIYDGSSYARTFLPVKADGTANLAVVDRMKEVQNIIDKNPNMTSEEINQLYANVGLSEVQVDAGKNFIESTDFKPFIIFHAYTSDKSPISEDNNGLVNLDNVTEESKDLIKKKVIDGYYEAKETSNELSGWFWDLGNDYYKGIVAVPLIPEASLVAGSRSDNLTTDKTDIGTANANMMVNQEGIYLPQGAARNL